MNSMNMPRCCLPASVRAMHFSWRALPDHAVIGFGGSSRQRSVCHPLGGARAVAQLDKRLLERNVSILIDFRKDVKKKGKN